MVTRNYDFLDEQKNVIVLYDKMFPLYIIKGHKNFLLDSGVTARANEFYTNINQVLADTGSPSDEWIHTLLLTHTHWDHTGASYYLQQKYHFNVYASERAVELLQKDKVITFINRLNQDYKKMTGDTSDTTFGKLENLRPLREGDRIPVDDSFYFEVFDVPGHTQCSAAYLLHPQRILFPGDSVGVLEQNGTIKPLFLSSYLQYEHSLEKLLTLNAHTLAFAHNRLIKGETTVKTHLQNSLARTRQTRDEIIRLLHTGDPIPIIAETLFHQEFPKPTLLGPKEALMINLEAMVKTVQKECL